MAYMTVENNTAPQSLVTVLGEVDVKDLVRVDHVWRSIGEVGRRAAGRQTALVLELRGADDKVLSSSPLFTRDECVSGKGGGCGDEGRPEEPLGAFRFRAILRAPWGGEALVVRRGDEVVWRRDREPMRVAPAATAVLEQDGHILVEWKGDGDEAWIRGSIDGGKTWQALAVNLTGGSYRLRRSLIKADRVLLEVVTHDGFESHPVRIADEISLPHRSPGIAIVRPVAGSSISGGKPLHLWGSLLDPGTRGAGPEQAIWVIDGKRVGTGVDVWVPALAAGEHAVELHIEGGGGDAVSVKIRVDEPKPDEQE